MATFDLSEKEILAFNLMKYYGHLYRKIYSDNSYILYSPNKDPRKNLNFKYFLEFAEKTIENSEIIPDPKLYIKAQFEIGKIKSSAIKQNIKVCLPNQLLSKKSWNIYNEYIEYLNLQYIKKKSINNNIIIKNELLETFNQLKIIYENLFGIKKINYRKLFENDKFFVYIEVGIISKYFLSISKTYQQFKKEDLSEYKNEIFSNKELKIYCKKLFKEEMIK